MNDFIEFSRPIDVARLPAGGGSYELTASAEERAALAKRFELLTLDQLEARVQITRVAGGFYRLSAHLDATLTQACVITLEPVASQISEDFSLLYGTLDDENEVVLDSGSETVEPLEAGTIDIGEAVAQQLSLALDPFPHAPGAEPESGEISFGEPSRESPFAVLAKLRKTDES
jgi:uncharacterized metal-binding protein YceD (DUF177 family)